MVTEVVQYKKRRFVVFSLYGEQLNVSDEFCRYAELQLYADTVDSITN